jgi:hypothetical protein
VNGEHAVELGAIEDRRRTLNRTGSVAAALIDDIGRTWWAQSPQADVSMSTEATRSSIG